MNQDCGQTAPVIHSTLCKYTLKKVIIMRLLRLVYFVTFMKARAGANHITVNADHAPIAKK